MLVFFFLHYVQNVQDNVCGPDEGAQSWRLGKKSAADTQHKG